MLHATSEEVSILLSNEDGQAPPHRPVQSGRTRRALVAVAALVLAAGAVAVAVDRRRPSTTSAVVTMAAHQSEIGDEPAADMESQFGWSTLTDGFCHARAATWCMFKSDSATCKKEMCPDKAAPESSGSGSGSGSGSSHGFANVGDTSGHHSGSGN